MSFLDLFHEYFFTDIKKHRRIVLYNKKNLNNKLLSPKQDV